MLPALPALLAVALVATLPAVAADHIHWSEDSPVACEHHGPEGVCMDYCLYGLGPSYGVAVLNDGDVVRVWAPGCWVM